MLAGQSNDPIFYAGFMETFSVIKFGLLRLIQYVFSTSLTMDNISGSLLLKHVHRLMLIISTVVFPCFLLIK